MSTDDTQLIAAIASLIAAFTGFIRLLVKVGGRLSWLLVVVFGGGVIYGGPWILDAISEVRRLRTETRLFAPLLVDGELAHHSENAKRDVHVKADRITVPEGVPWHRWTALSTSSAPGEPPRPNPVGERTGFLYFHSELTPPGAFAFFQVMSPDGFDLSLNRDLVLLIWSTKPDQLEIKLLDANGSVRPTTIPIGKGWGGYRLSLKRFQVNLAAIRTIQLARADHVGSDSVNTMKIPLITVE